MQSGAGSVWYSEAMLPREEVPLLTLVKELDRLHDTQIDDEVRGLLRTLICEVLCG